MEKEKIIQIINITTHLTYKENRIIGLTNTGRLFERRLIKVENDYKHVWEKIETPNFETGVAE